jgi:hydrogenase maturation factor
MKLPLGKISADLLKEAVFRNLGVERPEVVLGPSAGIDGAVIEIGNHSVIVSTDPITGAIERIGWLAVNVNANDIATFGVEPAFLFSCILLPESAEKRMVENICVQMDQAARKLGISIAGGHCEVTRDLPNPIVIGCMMGITEKGNYVTAGNARPNDRIIMTKSAGIEGTAILASDREKELQKALKTVMLRRAKRFYERISIVKDALTAFKTGDVHAMHDPTEGGVAGAIHEMADASNLGVRILRERIRVEPETARICEFYGIDPLQLVASGSLLIASEPASAEKIVRTLRENKIHAGIIGQFLSSPEERLITLKNGKTDLLVRPVTDQLWQALEHSSVP